MPQSHSRLFPDAPAPAFPPAVTNPALAIRKVSLQLIADLHDAAVRLDRLGFGTQGEQLRRIASLLGAETCAVALDAPDRMAAPPLPAPRLHFVPALAAE